MDGEPAEAGDAAVPAGPTWSAGARLLAAAAVLVLGLGGVAVVVILSDPHRLGLVFSGAGPQSEETAEPAGTSGLGGAARAAAERAEEAMTAPLDGRERASFELVDGVTRFELRVTDLGEELYRITSPAESDARPRPELTGDRLRLRMQRIGDAPGAVEVLLNAQVSWELRITGGVTERRLDLTAGRLSALEFAGGATRTELRLPRTRGALVVRVTGGVNLLAVTVADGAPVRVRARSGAGGVNVYEERRDGVPPGTVLGSPNWDRSVDRIFLDLVAGANLVTVRRG
ncbi:hypothetical protein [Micromonospora radicis]|uniref:DUF2154 domain-containing protein n=1 Tax=Micromonospora radicis TaxID=1894971 RepID=A0A418N1A4_9ACTN|nr:hypothetical protein [Micromonospora radicis]RIV41318.1 hypothetical protein D2L64_01000 [Micromonospora radicis]